MKAKKKNIMLYIMAILLFHSSIIKFNYSQNGNVISLVLGVIVFLYLLLKHKTILKEKYLKTNTLIILFTVIALFSSIINGFYNFDGTVLYILKFSNLFLFFEYSGELGKNKNVIRLFFNLLLFYNLLTIYMLNQTQHLAYYHNYQYPFFASKFTLSYYFMISIALYVYAYKESISKKIIPKIFLVSLCFLSIYMANRVDCVTGIVGNILLFAILIFPFNFIKKIIRNKNTIMIIMILSSFLLILFYDVFMNIPFINHIVVDNFNRSITLSGRTVVYQKISEYLFSLKGLMFGYGYDGARRIFQEVMYISSGHYAYDAQNALLEIWMYFGFLGSIVFITLTKSIYSVFDDVNKKNNNEIYALSFVFIVLGVVEITYSFPLFLLFAIINSDSKSSFGEEPKYDKKSSKKMLYKEKASSDDYIKYLRKKGMTIGDYTVIYSPCSVVIDETRPFLINIGDHVKITYGVVILTHGYDWSVLNVKYNDILGSSGKVEIGNNVFI